jgi:hypothetical protein
MVTGSLYLLLTSPDQNTRYDTKELTLAPHIQCLVHPITKRLDA